MSLIQIARRGLLGLALIAFANAALAAPSALHVHDAWVRPTPAGMDMSGGYLTLSNPGKGADRLISATSPDVAQITLHSTRIEGGVARMVEMKNGVALAPGATVSFAPGGDHLMFEGIRRPLKVGDRVRVILHFEKAGAVPVRFEVRSASTHEMAPMPNM